MRLSLILPIYNEREELERNFDRVYKEVMRHRDSEIIIAEDGSTDGSKALVRKLSRRKNVRLLSMKHRTGRGGAIKRAVKVARGRVIGYMDIDMAVPLRYVDRAVRLVEDGNKVVIGSRYVAGATAERSVYRYATSKFYNIIVKVLLGSPLSDHQCGFKFWDGKYIKNRISKIRDDHWFFDTEMLVRAQREGIAPYELPVEWHEGEDTTVRFGDNIYFIKAVLRLRSRLKHK